MKLTLYSFALAFGSMAMLCNGRETLIAGHFGIADPTTEGFTLFRSGNPLLAPVTNDMGLDAWHIGLDTGADIGQYSRVFGDQDQAALQAGWILSLTLRVAEPFSTPTSAVFAHLQTGTESFPGFAFGAQSDGDPILRLGNTEYALEGYGAGYHSYQLRYDAGLDSASLWVDGALLATDIAGSPNPSARLAWGGGQHPQGSAYANWSEVSLWAVPEPSSYALLGVGGACLLTRILKRRRVVGA